jgi:type VI secretion system protein ImpF
MADTVRTAPLTSLLDRLRSEPRSVTTPRRELIPRLEQERAATAYRAQVVRDLAWLLNTRRVHDLDPTHFPELHASSFCFGLPDITGLAADAHDTPTQLSRWIEQTIRLFEPRLSQVRVRAVARDGLVPRRFRFTIHALLRVETAAVPVAFDTALAPGEVQWSVESIDA